MNLSTRDQITHLLRRLGLGASASEIAACEKMGVPKTIEWLLDFEKVDEGFPVNPWEFCFQEDGQVLTDPTRIGRWWALRLLMTKRPLQERLTLFWHDHFAVSGAKVESGVIMLVHLETLRSHCNGKFIDLLGAVTKDPAMIQWLDNDQSVRGVPNENFARELLELFTLGIGNYSETDVKECARSLTGWSLRSVIPTVGANSARARLTAAFESNIPLVASTYSDGYHDPGMKTILGETKAFDTDSLLDKLAKHPQTARYICGKLWEFFAYPNPEKAVIDRIAKVFQSTDGNIKSVIKAIVDSPEFWSEKCVRQQIKSPVDFTISIIRQLELGDAALRGRDPKSDWFTPISQYPRGVSEILLSAMRLQGMFLLYPPDVSGWEWGNAWVSPAMMMERGKFASYLLGPGRGTGTASLILLRARDAGAKSVEDVIDVLIDMFDVPVTATQREILIRALNDEGGLASLTEVQKASNALAPVVKLLFATPAFHLC
ncbi:MAG: DUF1800 domain-containing protein [Fimbriimonadaceae bacterium]|nr:DUF1800 domain-containing protein [Fimbriimonadaceae bacterium]